MSRWIGLLLLGALGVFGVKFAKQEEGNPSTGAATDGVERAKAETFTPSIAHPKAPVVVESSFHEDHAEQVHVEEIESAVAHIDSELTDSNAIERLNRHLASSDDRAHYDELFKAREELHRQRFALKLAEINEKISGFEKEHASKLDAFGIDREKTISE